MECSTENGTVGNRMGGYGLDSSGLGWGLLAVCEHRSEEIRGLTKRVTIFFFQKSFHSCSLLI